MTKTLTCLVLWIMLTWNITSVAAPILTPYQRLDTSGARDVTSFKLNGHHYLVIPQLARDIPHSLANMNGGDADVDVKMYRWRKGQFEIYQSLPGHGNEATEFFQIGNKSFLAVASIHSGPRPPYVTPAYSKLYQWDGRRFFPVQQFRAYASKNWKYFHIGNRHFLALANGIVLPGHLQDKASSSTLFEYRGGKFVPFQQFPSSWAYQWEYFTLGGHAFLGLTDHINASKLYRWNGREFKLYQSFALGGGRAFKYFKIKNNDYLAFANISHPSVVYKWNGTKFREFQRFEGFGGRNFLQFTHDNLHYLLQINFITGSRSQPKSNLVSPLYVWQDGKFKIVQKIKTYGGVNASFFEINKRFFIAIANSLSKELRFEVNSIIYQLPELSHESLSS